MTKTFSKAITQRMNFRDKFLENLTDQKNLTVIQSEYRKIRTRKNSVFGHFSRSIILVNYENIESNEKNVTETLNDFFSNVVLDLEIPEYECDDNLHNRLSSHPALQAIVKYSNQPSINIILRFSQRFSSFHFSHVDKNTLLKEIERLRAKKAIQDTDIPVKVLKENAEFFAEQICFQFNEAICSSQLSNLQM